MKCFVALVAAYKGITKGFSQANSRMLENIVLRIGALYSAAKLL